MMTANPGQAALSAILAEDALFPRIKPNDLSAAAIKLARKQVIAAGLGRDDLLRIRTALGGEIFDKTLDSLTPHHVKLLARRLDPSAPEIEVNTGSSALAHVRLILSGAATPSAPMATPEVPDAPAPTAKKNKYLGRKAFRTGR
jgi:hypothetical protein